MSNATIHWAFLSTALGQVSVAVNERRAVVAVQFGDRSEPEPGLEAAGAASQLEEYFLGKRHFFDLEVEPAGTDFERRVWEEVARISYGATASYGEIANRVGGGAVARAVGSANAANPVAIIIPCHRVVGAGGDLTGYAGGLDRKKWLLDMESGQQRLGFDTEKF